jgi:ribosomal protein L11 methyltransferase
MGNWQEEDSAFLFFDRPAEKALSRLLALRPDLTRIDNYHMKYEDWHGHRPTPFSAGRFRIRPPWEPDPGGRREEEIVLDPGVVFGTGTHATTRDCLEALQWLLPDRGQPQTALDLGTGTGLLAIAAAKLGCRRVLAVDLNPLAARTAAGNVRRNRLGGRVLTVCGRAEELIACPAELIIANMHHEVMQRLLASGPFPNTSWFLLSGLLRSQARETEAALRRQSIRVVRRWDHDGTWYTFLGTRP